MAVSDDLRERVVEAVVLGGLSRNQAAARFKVSVASAVRWVKRFIPRARFRRRLPGVIALRPDRGASRLSLGPDPAQAGHHAARDKGTADRQLRRALCGLVLWRFFDRHEITLKKTAHAEEQQRADVQNRRREWFAGQLDLDPTKLVFIDETGASTNLARKSGRCRRGRRLRAAIPHSHYKTVTLIAGLRLRGLTAARTFDGPINAACSRIGWRHASCPHSRPARSSSWTISPLTRGRGSSN